MPTLSQNTLEIVRSGGANVTTAVAKNFLFGTTPNSFKQQLDNHVKDTTFYAAKLRKMDTYTMRDAANVFETMEGNEFSHSVVIRFGGGVIPLMNEETSFGLKKEIVVTAGKKPYFGLVALAVNFRSMSSPFSEAGGVELVMKDAGNKSEIVMPRVEFNRNLHSNILVGLNYPVAFKDLSDISFTISTNSTGMRAGRQFATVEIQMKVVTSDKPVPRGMTRAAVQYILPSDILELTANDPRLFNAILNQEDLEAVRAIISDVPGSSNHAFKHGELKSTGSSQFGPPTIAPGESASNVGSSSSVPNQTVRFNNNIVTMPDVEEQPGDVEPTDEMLAAAADLMRSYGYTVAKLSDNTHRRASSISSIRPSVIINPNPSILNYNQTIPTEQNRKMGEDEPAFGIQWGIFALTKGILGPDANPNGVFLVDIPNMADIVRMLPTSRRVWYQKDTATMRFVVSNRYFHGGMSIGIDVLLSLLGEYKLVEGTPDVFGELM